MKYKLKKRIRRIKGFQVIGQKARSLMQHELESGKSEGGRLWFRLLDTGDVYQIPSRSNRVEFLTINLNFENDALGPVTVIAGQRVHEVWRIPEGLEVFDVPGGKYLVFTAEGDMPECASRVWRDIEGFFAKNPRYVRNLRAEFEVSHGDYTIEVYVAVD